MFNSAIARLRLIGFIEGISFLLLLGIAMPLKYIYGMPEAVKVVGMIHGLLFIAYLMAVAHVKTVLHWPLARLFGAFAAAMLPFGPFVFDFWLRRDERKVQGATLPPPEQVG